jgi:hypothetical protein
VGTGFPEKIMLQQQIKRNADSTLSHFASGKNGTAFAVMADALRRLIWGDEQTGH